jgi:2-polyprenyl-3-methyl-5-hydroxy-6-metoxy-1,4-benzoquinol methylase
MYLPELRCPTHGNRLDPRRSTLAGDSDPIRVEDLRCFHCAEGCRFPVIRGVPRFTNSDNYADAFGWQWLRFRTSQLDSRTGTTITRDRLSRCLGGDLAALAGLRVLDAGCGAGRFSEILLNAGADVFAVDISAAVEAAHINFGADRRFFVCQSDILAIPVAARSFDVVLCLGVIQHTPDPERTIAALAEHVRLGGLLIIDHYSTEYPLTPSRRALRAVLLRLPRPLASRLAVAMADLLLIAHKWFWHADAKSARTRRLLARWSPLVDYYDSYPQLARDVLAEWAVLDTHDTLMDVFKHLRTEDEIRACLGALDLEILHAAPGGNGIEARARRPRAIGGRASRAADAEVMQWAD